MSVVVTGAYRRSRGLSCVGEKDMHVISATSAEQHINAETKKIFVFLT